MPGIHRAKLQHIPEECPIRFRIVAIGKNMSTRDHGTTLPLGADGEQVPTPENRRRRPALHSANVSGAQCRGVSFALEAADPPAAYPRPISAASHVKDGRFPLMWITSGYAVIQEEPAENHRPECPVGRTA